MVVCGTAAVRAEVTIPGDGAFLPRSPSSWSPRALRAFLEGKSRSTVALLRPLD